MLAITGVMSRPVFCVQASHAAVQNPACCLLTALTDENGAQQLEEADSMKGLVLSALMMCRWSDLQTLRLLDDYKTPTDDGIESMLGFISQLTALRSLSVGQRTYPHPPMSDV